jgi:hypothetical protein
MNFSKNPELCKAAMFLLQETSLVSDLWVSLASSPVNLKTLSLEMQAAHTFFIRSCSCMQSIGKR